MQIPQPQKREVVSPADFCPGMNPRPGPYIFPLPYVSLMIEKERTTERLRSRKGLTDTSTWPMYVYLMPLVSHRTPTACMLSTYIDLRILEALLQIFIDCLVRDFTDQGKVRHPDLFLLRAFEHSFSHLWLSPSIICSFDGCGVFSSTGAFCNPLFPPDGQSAGRKRIKWPAHAPFCCPSCSYFTGNCVDRVKDN